jgi:MFS family permease
VTVPIFGKLSDIYRRKPVLLFGIVVFLVGSAASGAAQSMGQLTLFRAVQGLGAGAVQPITMTVIGDIFDLKERSRMQGIFGAVWGFFGLLGPIVGGFIVDSKSLGWRWNFYINIPFGVLAAVLIVAHLHERVSPEAARPRFCGRARSPSGSARSSLASNHIGLGVSLASGAGRGVPRRPSSSRRAPRARADDRAPPLREACDPDRERDRGIIGGDDGADDFVPLYVQGVLQGTTVRSGARSRRCWWVSRLPRRSAGS